MPRRKLPPPPSSPEEPVLTYFETASLEACRVVVAVANRIMKQRFGAVAVVDGSPPAPAPVPSTVTAPAVPTRRGRKALGSGIAQPQQQPQPQPVAMAAAAPVTEENLPYAPGPVETGADTGLVD